MDCKCRNLSSPETILAQLYGETVKPGLLCALKNHNHSMSLLINAAYRAETGALVGVYNPTCFYHSNKAVGCSKCPKFENKLGNK
jgi:hypothetical protein